MIFGLVIPRSYSSLSLPNSFRSTAAQVDVPQLVRRISAFKGLLFKDLKIRLGRDVSFLVILTNSTCALGKHQPTHLARTTFPGQARPTSRLSATLLR